MSTALLVLAGYLLGSMPWGYWLVRIVKRDDIRRHGSGNIGGTNVWRVYGWRLGLPVVLLDTAKGFVPALVGALAVSDLAGVLAGAAAMLGHWRPLFLRWQRGGKMVATCGGAFLGVAPVVGGLGAAVWIAVFLLFRYASLASILAALSLPIVAALLDEPWPVLVFAAAAAVAVVVLHRANIARLRSGTENRFKFRGLTPKGSDASLSPLGGEPLGTKNSPATPPKAGA
jgi:glycerol-3-phosphate acyltransferase PlsY